MSYTVIRDNSWRLAAFRTRTVISEEANKKSVCKYALTEEARSFLKVIVEREKANVDYLRGHFSVLCGVVKDDHIEYAYCPNRSLEIVIGDYLARCDYNAADAIVQEYVRKLRSLKIASVFPEEFLKIVGDREGGRFVADAFTRGVIDLTPPNILLDGSRWIVLDNEWSFDFPVPIVFVLFRAIASLVNKFQRQVRLNTSEDNPAISLLTRKFRNMYFPQAWVDYFSDSSMPLERLVAWERGFQKYVTGGNGGVVYKVNKDCAARTGFLSLRFRQRLERVWLVRDLMRWGGVL